MLPKGLERQAGIVKAEIDAHLKPVSLSPDRRIFSIHLDGELFRPG